QKAKSSDTSASGSYVVAGSAAAQPASISAPTATAVAPPSRHGVKDFLISGTSSIELSNGVTTEKLSAAAAHRHGDDRQRSAPDRRDEQRNERPRDHADEDRCGRDVERPDGIRPHDPRNGPHGRRPPGLRRPRS